LTGRGFRQLEPLTFNRMVMGSSPIPPTISVVIDPDSQVAAAAGSQWF
jgi:hypothetical protein